MQMDPLPIIVGLTVLWEKFVRIGWTEFRFFQFSSVKTIVLVKTILSPRIFVTYFLVYSWSGYELLEFCRKKINQLTKVKFASFQSGAFVTVIVVNPPESKLAKRTSVQLAGVPH